MAKKAQKSIKHPLLIPALIAGALVIGIMVTMYGASMQTSLDSQAAGPQNNSNMGGRTNAQARVMDAQGKQLGTVRFLPAKKGVTVRVSMKGLTPGFHGFHIHDTGACVAPFTTAGGHWSLVAGAVQPNHTGDLPVLYAQADGTVHQEFTTDRFTITDLFDANGSAVIVHGAPDNFANIPTRYQPPADDATLKTGDAGARVACGMIEHTGRQGNGTGTSGSAGISGPTGSSGYAFLPGAGSSGPSGSDGWDDEDTESN